MKTKRSLCYLGLSSSFEYPLSHADGGGEPFRPCWGLVTQGARFSLLSLPSSFYKSASLLFSGQPHPAMTAGQVDSLALGVQPGPVSWASRCTLHIVPGPGG